METLPRITSPRPVGSCTSLLSPESEERHVQPSRGHAIVPSRVTDRRQARRPASNPLQRRRRVLATLMIAAVATFLLAIVASGPGLWDVQVIADVAVVADVAILLHLRNAAAGVEMTHQALGG